MGSSHFNLIYLALSAGFTFGILAYFITYKNFYRHYKTTNTPRIIALATAIVIFISFTGSMLVTTYLIKK